MDNPDSHNVPSTVFEDRSDKREYDSDATSIEAIKNGIDGTDDDEDDDEEVSEDEDISDNSDKDDYMDQLGLNETELELLKKIVKKDS